MTQRTRLILALCLLATGSLCIAQGIAAGELSIILRKAVLVCLECIGIG